MKAPPFLIAKDRVGTETLSMIQQVGRVVVARAGVKLVASNETPSSPAWASSAANARPSIHGAPTRAPDGQRRTLRSRALHRCPPEPAFATWVQVTRLDGSGRTVVVRINDRCAGNKKIIDLSEAAARPLEMIRAGSVRVRIRVV